MLRCFDPADLHRRLMGIGRKEDQRPIPARRDSHDPGQPFVEAMHPTTGLSHPANIAIAQQLPWAKYRSFVDIGTGQGDLAVQIARHNPHLVGIGFDLGPVGPVFTDYVAAHGLSERLRFIAGDFFADALPQADVVLMGHILHDWHLDEKQTLIRRAYEALPEGGTFVAYEAIIDDERRKNAFGLLMSLNMLIGTPGGFDYTGADCCGWMKAAPPIAQPTAHARDHPRHS
jgi:SAM-dependent methyltransferase